jgi:site-specific recombinase XerD
VPRDTRRAIGARDAGLLAALYGLGLRRVEAVALVLSDYSPSRGEVRVRHGKGNKERLMYTNAASAQALNDWLAVRGDWAGPLFPDIARWGHIQPHPLTPRGVGEVLKQRTKQAGVAPFTAHDLRTFISTLLDRTVDLPTVQQLAGHINIQTTALYDRRGERTKQAAMPLLPVPYVPPTA